MLVNRKVPLMIEVKRNERYKELMPKLKRMLEKYDGEYVIESFDPRVIYWLRKNAPDVIRGQLAAKNLREISNKTLKYLLGKMAFNVITKPNFVSYVFTEVDENFYKKQKAKNRDVAVWTVKNKEDYERVKGCADMYIFENEETIR